MRHATTRVLTLALLLGFVALAVGASAAAQEATPDTELGGPDIELLALAPLGTLPPAPLPIVLARITFATNAGLFMNANPGPALHYVESGGFEVLAGGGMTLYRPGSAIGEEMAQGTTFTIAPGDLLVIPANAPFEVFNRHQEPAVALIVEMFSRPPGTTFPEGIGLQPLVAGTAEEVPPAPVSVALARLTYPPGLPPGAETSGGIALVYVESGTLTYRVESGAAQITQAAIATPAAVPPTNATPGAEVTFNPGDAIFEQFGTFSEIRIPTDEPAVVLFLGIYPDESSSVEPAATPAP